MNQLENDFLLSDGQYCDLTIIDDDGDLVSMVGSLEIDVGLDGRG